MKSLSPSSNLLSLLVIIVTFSFLNTFPTALAKHNKAGGHHKPEPVVPPNVEPQPVVVPPQPVVEPQPVVVPPQPVVEPQPVVVPPQPVVEPAAHPSETTYEIHVINHASEGMDTVDVVCNPGPPPGGPPPPTPPCGPPVPPHLLKVGESFSWTFEYPDASADVSYTCIIDWIGHNKGLVSLFDKDTYTDAECRADNGNHCYWTIAPEGFYFSNKDGPFPGPNWTFRWPWGV